jgi:penicillin G amidase
MLPRRSEGPEARFLDMLKDWDRVLRSPSVAGALYEVWERRLGTALVQKMASVSLGDFTSYLNTQQAMDYLKSLRASDQQQLLLSTLADAGYDMEQKEGADPALWSWGAMHTITFRHALDELPQAKALFDLGPLSRPGDGDTVDATAGADFHQMSGASYREIFDLSNWDNGLAINTPGQSGQPGSRHYSDLLPLWEAGQYFPLVYSKEAVEENAADVLTLVPAAAAISDRR